MGLIVIFEVLRCDLFLAVPFTDVAPADTFSPLDSIVAELHFKLDLQLQLPEEIKCLFER